jgi:triosephosphate isomerase
MYMGVRQSRDWVSAVVTELASGGVPPDVDLVCFPSFTALEGCLGAAEGSGMAIGAQDLHWEDTGAFTGEVSGAHLRELGCTWVELGHAERRRLFGEDDATTARKAAAAVRNGLEPLVCIGEVDRLTHAEAVAACGRQVMAVLDGIPPDAPVTFGYEPVWAIGAADAAPSAHVCAVLAGLKELWAGRQGSTRIIYGGSAQEGTFTALAQVADGLFLGRFAHDPSAFVRILHEIAGA